MVNVALTQDLQVGFKGSIMPLVKSGGGCVAIPWALSRREAMSNGCNIDEVRDAVETIERATASIDASTRRMGVSLDTLADRVATRTAGRAESDRPIGHYVKLARQELGIAS